MLFLEYRLGERIRYFRKQRGFTQKELAKMVGLNESTVRNYELGNRTPDLDTLVSIAGALQVSYYALSMPDMRVPVQVIHMLFEMEDLYGFKPEMIGNDLVLRLDIDRGRELFNKMEPSEGDPTITEEEKMELFEILDDFPTLEAALRVDSMIYEWYIARQHLDSGDMDKDMYYEWKMRYPSFSSVNEDGQLIAHAENQMLYPMDPSLVPDADPERDYYANAELSPIMLKKNLISIDEYEKMKEKESGGKKFKAKRMIKKLKRKGQ